MTTTRTNLLTTYRRRAKNCLSRSSRGVFRRRSIGGARCGCPATVARNRRLTREVKSAFTRVLTRYRAPPARHYDLAARSSLHGLRRIMPQTEARPTAKNRHGGAPRGARLSAEGRRAFRKTPGLPRHVQAQPVLSAASVRLSALRHPSSGRVQVHKPGRIAPRERDGLFEIVRRECGSCRANDALDRPHAEEHRSTNVHRQRHNFSWAAMRLEARGRPDPGRP